MYENLSIVGLYPLDRLGLCSQFVKRYIGAASNEVLPLEAEGKFYTSVYGHHPVKVLLD